MICTHFHTYYFNRKFKDLFKAPENKLKDSTLLISPGMDEMAWFLRYNIVHPMPTASLLMKKEARERPGEWVGIMIETVLLLLLGVIKTLRTRHRTLPLKYNNLIVKRLTHLPFVISNYGNWSYLPAETQEHYKPWETAGTASKNLTFRKKTDLVP